MARGRKPKPAAVKKAAGNPGKRAIKPDPLASAPGVKSWPAPSFLCAIGKGLWDRVVPPLDRLGMISDVNAPLLAIWCDNWATFRRCKMELKNRGGVFYEDAKGNIKTHPAARLAKDLGRELRTAAADFGITPSSAGKVQPVSAMPGQNSLDLDDAGNPDVDPDRPQMPSFDEIESFVFGGASSASH